MRLVHLYLKKSHLTHGYEGRALSFLLVLATRGENKQKLINECWAAGERLVNIFMVTLSFHYCEQSIQLANM